MKIGEIKNDTKAFLKDNYWTTLGLCLLYVIVAGLISGIAVLASNYIPIFGGLAQIAASICVSVPLAYGFAKNLFDLKKGKTKSVTDFFEGGFSNFQRAISTWWSSQWRKTVKTIPGAILSTVGAIFITVGIFSGIIDTIANLQNMSDSALVVSEIQEELEDLNVDTDVLGTTAAITLPVGIVLVILGVLISLPFSLEYAVSDLIAVDRTDLDGAQVAHESEYLMKGNRMKYIGLMLSFAGWWILALLTCSIGFVFLIPYVQMARVSFYESLKEGESPVVSDAQNVIQ